jgi:hypothetical protein
MNDQTKPPPDAREKTAIEAAQAAVRSRRPRIQLTVKRNEKGSYETRPTHNDDHGWGARLLNAFGTDSVGVLNAEMSRIGGILRDKDGNINPDEMEAVVAIVDGAEPANEIEGNARAADGRDPHLGHEAHRESVSPYPRLL